MTAPSDMGGRTEFFAPVVRESEEPVFHERGEGRVFGFANFLLPLLGRNVDILRFGMEQVPREVYLSSYYRRWLGGFETLLEQAGYLTPGEVRPGSRADPPARRRISRSRLNYILRAVGSLLHPNLPAGTQVGCFPIAGQHCDWRRAAGASHRATTFGWQYSSGAVHPTAGIVTAKPGVTVAKLGATVFPDAESDGQARIAPTSPHRGLPGRRTRAAPPPRPAPRCGSTSTSPIWRQRERRRRQRGSRRWKPCWWRRGSSIPAWSTR